MKKLFAVITGIDVTNGRVYTPINAIVAENEKEALNIAVAMFDTPDEWVYDVLEILGKDVAYAGIAEMKSGKTVMLRKQYTVITPYGQLGFVDRESILG